MLFQLFILTLSTLLSLLSASAIPNHSSAVLESITSSLLDSTNNTEISPLTTPTRTNSPTNITTPLLPRETWHGKPYCNPTGSGVCNMAFYSAPADFSGSINAAYVYNKYCRQIGYKFPAEDTFDVFSELPYVVIGDMNWLTFKYAGGYYGGRSSQCTDYWGDEDQASAITQCAFDCGDGAWQNHRSADRALSTPDAG